MAVTLRLTRTGKKNKPSYRVVAAENSRPRDGRFLEVVGQYDPRTNPGTVNLKEDRVRYWLSVGAQTSAVVRTLIAKNIPGLVEGLEKSRLDKKQAARRKRKERLQAGGASKKAAAPKKSKAKKA